MPYPGYNPCLNLVEAVKAQGYDTGEVPLSLSNTKYPMGSFPLEPTMQDHPAPSFEQALRRGPLDSGEVKYLPHSKDSGF